MGFSRLQAIAEEQLPHTIRHLMDSVQYHTHSTREFDSFDISQYFYGHQELQLSFASFYLHLTGKLPAFLKVYYNLALAESAAENIYTLQSYGHHHLLAF